VGPEETSQAGISDGEGLVPSEPANLLALPGWRVRLVRPLHPEEVAEIEVDMPPPAGVNIDVRQWGGAVRAKFDPAQPQAGLLLGFAARRHPRGLPLLQVPAGLQPHSQPLVTMKDHPAPSENERGGGYVGGVGVLVEWARQPSHGHQEPVPGAGLAPVYGLPAPHGLSDGGEHSGVVGLHG